MIEITFEQFHNQEYVDVQEVDPPDYQLYVVKNGLGEVLYVGISKVDIWERWFGGAAGHMQVGSDGQPYGLSRIGKVIERRLPAAWSWKIELWTEKDCRDFLMRETNFGDHNTGTIETLEPLMIQRMEPLYNVSHGGGQHEDPLISKKLDDAHRKLFD